MPNKYGAFLEAAYLVYASGIAGKAHAQDAPFQLEKVLVTAQKKTQSLQDFPLSISMLSGEELAASGTRSFQDRAIATPGVFISGSGWTRSRSYDSWRRLTGIYRRPTTKRRHSC